jgi:hypothetical protein
VSAHLQPYILHSMVSNEIGHAFYAPFALVFEYFIILKDCWSFMWGLVMHLCANFPELYFFGK